LPGKLLDEILANRNLHFLFLAEQTLKLGHGLGWDDEIARSWLGNSRVHGSRSTIRQ
jgi:hypothetical protein